MTRILGLDLETTGLSPEEHHIIEIAGVLWDTEINGPLACYSVLVKDCADPEISPEIEKLTGITKKAVMEYGQGLESAMSQILILADEADYLCAHNVPFERSWLELAGYEFTIPWLDTLTDLPDRQGSGKLTYLAADHGFVNPFPHRALPDVLTMLAVLSRYDFAEVERYALAPTITLRVAFGYDPEKVSVIKALGGWRFHSETKEWRKDIKEFNLQAEIGKVHAAGFQPFVLQKAGAA